MTFVLFILDMQLKLDQEKVARQSAENRLLEVEKYKSELSVDIKQYEQQIANLQNEYRSEKDKVKWISSLISYYLYYVLYTYILSLIRFARMDFSVKYHIEGKV